MIHLAGALGNLLDSLFYGLIFTDSPYSCFSGNYDSLTSMLHNHNREAVAHLTKFGAGYGKVLQGKVVDMLYFPIIDTQLPSWIPFWAGKVLFSLSRYLILRMPLSPSAY